MTTPKTTDRMEEARIAPPFGDQRFDTFDQWVSRASSWLTCHAEYNNAEHGGKGWRGHHFTALCFDSFGRRCRIGADMQRARDEGAFPVWWIWPDQIVDALSTSEAKGRQDGVREGMKRAAEIAGQHFDLRHHDKARFASMSIRAAILSNIDEANQ